VAPAAPIRGVDVHRAASQVRAAPPVVSSARLSAAVHNGERLQALDAEGLLAGSPEPIFDRFARLASRVAEAPTALVSVVTDERQYFAGLCGVADRLRAEMPAGLTASAGITTWASPQSAEQVVTAADRALYRAKRDGRDRICLG